MSAILIITAVVAFVLAGRFFYRKKMIKSLAGVVIAASIGFGLVLLSDGQWNRHDKGMLFAMIGHVVAIVLLLFLIFFKPSKKKYLIAGAAVCALSMCILGMHEMKVGPWAEVRESRPMSRSAGGSGSLSSPSTSNESARQLIREYAEARHGRNAEVDIQSGFYGGAYQVTVRVQIHGGTYDGGYDRFTYTATVNESAQQVTSWQLVEHN